MQRKSYEKGKKGKKKKRSEEKKDKYKYLSELTNSQ